MSNLLLHREGEIATLILNRPEVHNAFDGALVMALRDRLRELAQNPQVRVVILTGAGGSFCAGGDTRWMRASLDWDAAENLADAERMADMYEAAWSLPKPLIGCVRGAAIGGGAGLVACCDLVVADADARFGFGEVKLGLIPAVIAQYVVPKIGISQARALFVSGERFTAERAFEIGLIHAVTPTDDLQATVQVLARRMLSGGPQAIAAVKQAVDAVWHMERAAAQRYLVETIAALRVGAEAQEGLRAFLEKRSPEWGQR